MAIEIVTNQWRMTGCGEPQTLVHIKRLGCGCTVSRPRANFPALEVLWNMPEKEFNEMCRVSYFETMIPEQARHGAAAC